MIEKEVEILKEYKSCFGNYIDNNDKLCENAQYCSYCNECKRHCVNY